MYLDDNIKAELKKQLSVLTKNVKMILFSKEIDCQFCRETKDIFDGTCRCFR